MVQTLCRAIVVLQGFLLLAAPCSEAQQGRLESTISTRKVTFAPSPTKTVLSLNDTTIFLSARNGILLRPSGRSDLLAKSGILKLASITSGRATMPLASDGLLPWTPLSPGDRIVSTPSAGIATRMLGTTRSAMSIRTAGSSAQLRYNA
jgi:hypothetical protein